jgi:3-hydroxyanthranilate 3,4-dioxygenase
MPRLAAFNFQTWIADHKHALEPPVGNQQIWEDADLMVTVVGGPNMRTDFHDDPVEEFLYQMKGSMVLKVRQEGQVKDVRMNEGDIFLIPPHLRHSPQRPMQGSLALVVEPARPEGWLDGFEWYCFNCGNLLYRAEIDLVSIVHDLPPVFANFADNVELHKCKKCGAVHPGKQPPPGWVSL